MSEPYYSDEYSTVYHCDALDLIPDLPAFDALVTDPPYSSGGMFRGDRTRSVMGKYQFDGEWKGDFSGDSRDQRGYTTWASLWLRWALARAAKHAALCMFTDWRQLPTVTDAVQVAGWVYRGIGVWNKPAARPNRGAFASDAEFVVHGVSAMANHDSDYYPRAVFRQSMAPGERQHPTEKPVAMMGWLVQFSPAGGVVVDPFMGSGSTLVAAKNHGRKAIGCDVDERWCEVTAERLRQGVLGI